MSNILRKMRRQIVLADKDGKGWRWGYSSLATHRPNDRRNKKHKFAKFNKLGGLLDRKT